MSGFYSGDKNEQFERAKQKFSKISTLNQIIDDDSQLSKDEKINALVMIAKGLIDEQDKYEKAIDLKDEKIKQVNEEI